MSAPTPRKRKAAAPLVERTVKTSIVIGAELHTKLAAAAAMRGVPANAIVVEALTDALGGIVVFDRRKGVDRGKVDDRPSPGLAVSESEDEAA